MSRAGDPPSDGLPPGPRPAPPPGPPPGPRPAQEARRRRVRYSGSFPRRFEDKYKERDPLAHPEVVASVLASGKTPAGSHRPICVQEILEILAPQPGETAVDATLGHGGHAEALLERLRPGGRLIGVDADPLELPRTEARLRGRGFGEEFMAVRSNMAALPRILESLGLPGAHLVVADLGCSSMQLDDPARGFSYKREGPLDLRMNPRKGRPAAELVAGISESELAALLERNADEPRSRSIARHVVLERERAPLRTTTDLVRAVRRAIPAGSRGDEKATLARVFQALRIEVNDEMGTLEAFLRALPRCLLAGGRVAVLTFHSGEDRRVKHAFQQGWQDGAYCEISREIVRPGPAEIRANPRASSAKLRWARRPPADGGS